MSNKENLTFNQCLAYMCSKPDKSVRITSSEHLYKNDYIYLAHDGFFKSTIYGQYPLTAREFTKFCNATASFNIDDNTNTNNSEMAKAWCTDTINNRDDKPNTEKPKGWNYK